MERIATIATEQLLTELAKNGQLKPIGASDIATLLGMERQRQLVGCSESAQSCQAELVAALGVEWLATGSLGRLGSSLRIDLKVLRGSDGAVTYRGGRTLSNESGLFDAVTGLADEILALEVFRAGDARPAGAGPTVALIAGGVALLAGIVVSTIALVDYSNVRNPAWRMNEFEPTQRAAIARFDVAKILGPILIGLGAVAGVGGWLWQSLSGEAPRK